MATRYNAKDLFRYGVKGVPTGYDGIATGDYNVPSCGIEDVDRAVLSLFENEISVHARVGSDSKRVKVIFAAQEKWAQVKRDNGMRDASGTLILPLIVVARTDFVQSRADDISGRGINQMTGALTVRRKLSQHDRGLQNILNRTLLPNQGNVAVAPGDVTVQDQLTTRRDVGLLSDDPTIREGGELVGDLRTNITEIVTLPAPQFMTMRYEIMLWAQHQQQMNQIVESIVSSYLPQTRGWRLDTDKGYWFVATVTSDDFRNEGNASDQAGQERVLKHTMLLEVPAFVIASDAPGLPAPVRVHFSNPTVSFDVAVGTSNVAFDSRVVDEPFLGSDDPTLPLGAQSRRHDLRDTGHGRVFPNPTAMEEHDPALQGLRRGQKPSKWRRVTVQLSDGSVEKRYVRIRSYDGRTGEVTFDAAQLEGTTLIAVDG